MASFSKHHKSAAMVTYQNLFFIKIYYLKVYLTVQYFAFLKGNQSKFIISNIECLAVIFDDVITDSIFLAQQIITKTDLRCFEKLGPDLGSFKLSTYMPIS